MSTVTQTNVSTDIQEFDLYPGRISAEFLLNSCLSEKIHRDLFGTGTSRGLFNYDNWQSLSPVHTVNSTQYTLKLQNILELESRE